MKKILNLIYSSNEWYDDLPTGKREIFFILVILAPIVLVNYLLYVCDLWFPMLIWFVVFFSWRLPYAFRVKKTYVFDIETQGLNSKFDVAFIVKRDKDKNTGNPEIIDTFTMMTKINEKK